MTKNKYYADAIIFIGGQATGKSSFYKEKFYDSHLRINLDMIKTRNREAKLIDICIETQQHFVIDNTNPTIIDREKYINKIPKSKFKIIAYYFESKIEDMKLRNNQREGKKNIPLPGLLSVYNKLELPNINEGFDEIFFVKIAENNDFIIEEWKSEVK